MFISLTKIVSWDGGRVKTKGVCSNQKFLESIDTERLRSDRSGLEFSLITLDIRQLSVEKQIGHIVNAINRRIRKIDSVGWCDNHLIGILLPYTSRKGAYKLSEDLYELIKSVSPNLYLRVHTYPLASDHGEGGKVYLLNQERGVK